MSNHPDRIARAITRFVENPVTNLVKGIVLFLIGLSEASKTFTEDLARMQLRVGHGLIILGVFAVLGAVPHLIDSLESGRRYLEFRDEKARPDSHPAGRPEERDHRAH